MKTNTINRETVLMKLKELKGEFENRYGVTRIGIFGSLSRDEAGEESDIDVVVVMREPDLFFMVHMKEILEQHFYRPVDIVRYRETMNIRLKARIDREAIYV
jgi:predicted nucleotidyltransferase